MNKTHCLTAALAVLLAAPTAVATQTANAQTVQEAAKANAQQMIILSEDFSKMTAGSESNPDSLSTSTHALVCRLTTSSTHV